MVLCRFYFVYMDCLAHKPKCILETNNLSWYSKEQVHGLIEQAGA